METNFENQVKVLRDKVKDLLIGFSLANNKNPEATIKVPEDLKREFDHLVDQVNLSLMDDKENFYGYFLFQMSREIRFDITSPTGVNFKGSTYVIYFNPLIFLKLNRKQMETTIKHEILHIVSMHLIRSNALKGKYSPLAINMAMDIVVNAYLEHLPSYATTLEWVNNIYGIRLEAYRPFEYYAEKLQTVLDLRNEAATEKFEASDTVETEYSVERTHDLWEESGDIEEETLRELTEKVIHSSEKGVISAHLQNIIDELKNRKGELPWNLYLNRIMGTVESNRKKTTTRRNRRQPDRTDLKGELRNHKARIIVALDISGSISDEEFKQAMEEVLNIVKNYNHEITILECDDEIRREYPVKSIRDIRDRLNVRGGTRFSPVFEYANHHRFNLLVYFTDGKGEEKLKIIPRGYQVLWVISGRGEQLSLKKPYGAVKKLKYIEAKDTLLDSYDVEKGGFSMNNQERA